MAMKRNNKAAETATTTETPAVEVEVSPEVSQPTAEVEAAGSAQTVEVVTETAVAVKQAAPAPMVSRPKPKHVAILAELENGIVLDFGVLPKLKASNGNIIDGDGKLLGGSAVVEIESWNKQYVVGPNANEAPNELAKYTHCRDGFEDGSGTLEDYVAELKAAGWQNAGVKEYFEVIGTLVSSEKPSDLAGELVMLQLSPTSVKEFEGYRLKTSFSIARGKLPECAGSTVIVKADVVTAKGNTWTKFSFKAKVD
jgi:hypothetical protein